jgi:hypothetical protein
MDSSLKITYIDLGLKALDSSKTKLSSGKYDAKHISLNAIY